jgi:hypothetical protein
MIEARIAKAIMVGSLAIFALLPTFDNLTDYDTNYVFVGHVLSTDTTFPGNRAALSAHHVAGVMAGRVCADHRRRGADRPCPSGRDHLSHPASALRRRPLQSCKELHDHRGGPRVSGAVFPFYDRWRRVVFDVAIANVERPGGGISAFT